MDCCNSVLEHGPQEQDQSQQQADNYNNYICEWEHEADLRSGRSYYRQMSPRTIMVGAY